jgi:hypothetical protein
MRIVSNPKFTIDTRWVVVANFFSKDFESIVFDPGNDDEWSDLLDCLDFVKEN